MQLFPPTLSAMPSPGTVQAPLAGLQGVDNFADPGPDQGGLFALLLSRLDVESPAASPLTTVPGPAVAAVATQIAAPQLPPTGKLLPLPLSGAGVEVPRPSITVDVDTTAATPGETLLPLPGLPQPLQQPERPGPAIVTTPRLPATAPEAVPSPLQPVVAVRNAATGTAPPQPAAPPANSLPVAELAEDVAPPAQNTTPSNPAVAVSPSLNPVPAAPAASVPSQHAYTLNQPVADPRWGNELGQRLIWMTDNGIGRAELRMNPPELGPVEVRISVSNDDARVAFHAQHGATREALESAMPRLREMFAAQGLNLSDANVSEHSAQQRREAGQSGSGGNRADVSLEGDVEMADAPDRVRTRSPDAVIDTYV